MSTSSATDDRLVARFYITGRQLAMMSVSVLLLLGAAAMLVSPLRRGPAIVSVISGGLTALFALLGVSLVLVVLRPLTLTETTLLVPRVFRSYRRISLVDLASVGMVFVRGRRFAQWVPYVWLPGGTPVRLPGRTFDFEQPPQHPGDQEPSWEIIADSPPGQMCRQIHQVALRQQGPSGPLAVDGATFRDNEAAPDSGYAAQAFWSPIEAVGIGYPPPGR
ncbi:MAG: hypothetical protein ACXVWU_02565 [Nocardioides sp.]